MGKVLAKSALVSHPNTPVPSVSVGAKVSLVGTDVLKLEYVVVGVIADFALPRPRVPEQADELWKHSCFEAFIALGDGPYLEANFAPSRAWALYRFNSYRNGMAPASDLPTPEIYQERSEARFALDVWLDLKPLAAEGPRALGLSAVLEKWDGTKSYWALHHPAPAPDFHHPEGFSLTLSP